MDNSVLVKIALMVAGFAIFAASLNAGSFLSPGKGLKGAVTTIAICIAAALVLVTIDHFTR